MSKVILLISPEAWDAHAVSKHHYARTLVARGHDVLFVNPPSSDARTLTIEPLREYGGHLRVVNGPAVARGLRHMPALLRNAIERRWLARLERKIGREVSIVWLFENSRFFDLSFAEKRLKIYHQVDLNQDYNVQKAAATADICFCTTDMIREKLVSFNSRAFKIHHGTVVMGAGEGCVSSYAPPSTPSVTYIGNLDMAYLDHAAICRLIEDYRHVQFNLVGGVSEDNPIRVKHNQTANVRWWGKLPFEALPKVLAGSDVLLVVYARQYQNEQANPHKFMEYLLSGRVVVCSYTGEYKDKRHLVEMAEPDEEIDGVFARVISDLGRYNAQELQQQRRAFALDHSYDRQLNRIIKHMDEAGLEHGLNRGDLP